MGAVLSLTNLRKAFGGRVAVDGLSLEIKRGEVFGLLGPNGAGKSTTINMAVGLQTPDSGSVRVDGRDPQDPRTRMRVGVAPQSLAIYEELTATENLRFFGQLYGLTGARLKDAVGACLARVGLEDRADSRVDTYSGGMKRRLNLAVAIVHDPALVMLDEPTVGVDPQSRNAIFDLIEGMRQEGRTVLYTTHYMEEAQRLCDRVGIIDHGKLLAIDSVDSLIHHHGGKSLVRFESDRGDSEVATEDPVGELSRALREGDVRSVRIDRPNLESVFLTLTGRSLRD
jgi:ABC-2 type transport system ATP-binding protein